VSRSMTVTEEKARSYGAVAGLLACACGSTEADARILTTTAIEPRPFGRPEEIESSLACDAASSIFEQDHISFRRRSLRVVVSDFLFPHDPDVLVGRLAREGCSLAILQLTLAEEAEPTAEGGRRLLDVEGRGELDLVIDDKAVQEYRDRFNRLRQGLARAARRAGGGFAHVIAGTPLRSVARSLVSAGILESGI
jgi:hypothetical protein